MKYYQALWFQARLKASTIYSQIIENRYSISIRPLGWST